MKLLLLIIFAFLFTSSLFAQIDGRTNDERYQVHIKKAADKIVIDGILDEPDWQHASSAGNFWQNFPFDSSLAQQQTEAKVTFDDQFLYISAICYQPDKYIVQSLRRDYPNGTSDIFFVNIDPFKDKQNSFYFSVTPYGTQKEGLIFGGSENNFDWDNKWYSEATRHEDKYIVEIAIPFKTLRYKLDADNKDEWNINFCRNNLVLNERSSWAPIPRNFRMINTNFNGSMVWDEPPPAPGKNFAFIPFILAGRNKNFIGNTPVNNDFEAGFDAKIGITPSLNLDLTVNPDFAQVEVDRQVTNLSRFELFFPERRQFFLENNDLFGSFGFRNVTPFFSRRIGIGKNVNNGENVRVPIIAGARLSGRINKDWRIGFLNMQSSKSEDFGLPATNFTVAALQRRVGARNFLGVILVNKDELNNKASTSRFNRTAGIDYNLAGEDGKVDGKFFIHRNITPLNLKGQYAMGGNLEYNSRSTNFNINVENIGLNYNAGVGFVPRNGYFRAEGSENFIFYPKGKLNKWINNWRIGPDFDVYYGKEEKRLTDWDAGLFFRIGFRNGAEMNGALARWDYTYLFESFDPTNQGCIELAAGRSFTYFSNRISFRSNPRKKLFYSLNTRLGEYFNGQMSQLQTTWSYRLNTFGIISLDVNYTKINLPAPFCDADLWLIGPKAELSFSKSVFFNTFFTI